MPDKHKIIFWTLTAKLGYRKFVLISQVQANEFYKKIGYVADGDEFMEAGIPHIKMIKTL
jgi:predicted GNAT family N-acyltransferase